MCIYTLGTSTISYFSNFQCVCLNERVSNDTIQNVKIHIILIHKNVNYSVYLNGWFFQSKKNKKNSSSWKLIILMTIPILAATGCNSCI